LSHQSCMRCTASDNSVRLSIRVFIMFMICVKWLNWSGFQNGGYTLIQCYIMEFGYLLKCRYFPVTLPRYVEIEAAGLRTGRLGSAGFQPDRPVNYRNDRPLTGSQLAFYRFFTDLRQVWDPRKQLYDQVCRFLTRWLRFAYCVGLLTLIGYMRTFNAWSRHSLQKSVKQSTLLLKNWVATGSFWQKN